jgi:predicted transcriptional regulator
MAEMPENVNGKTRKRPAAKAATGQVAAKVKAVKATIHLSVEADKRLSLHAMMMDMDRSELIEKLIHEHLRRYVVSDRGGDGAASGEAVA